MELDYVAKLARLKLSEEEKDLFSKQVGSVIEYINKLNELDTSDVEPTAHIFPVRNVFREDELKTSLPQDSALQNAPDRDDGFFRVPGIIE